MDQVNGTHGVMAVPDMLAGQGAVGCIVWWRMSGELDLERLKAEWSNEGLPTEWLLDHPSEKVAMARAVHHHFDRVVKLKDEWHWGVIDESVQGDNYDSRLTARFRLNDSQTVESDCIQQDNVPAVQESYGYFRSHVIQYDVSVWLCRMMDRLAAVGLRDTGGIYFVPARACAEWEAIVRCVRASSKHTLSYAPAMRSGEALDAIIDAVTQETARLAERLAGCTTDETLGPKALRSRAKEARSQAEKLHDYEKLVGRKVEGLGEQLASLEAMLGAAALSAMAKEEAEAAKAAGATP